jgi:hypothetical protein
MYGIAMKEQDWKSKLATDCWQLLAVAGSCWKFSILAV